MSPEVLARALAPVLRKLVEREVALAYTRTLADSFRGVWNADESYRRGDLVVCRGSTFIALSDTSARPAESPDWQLIAQRGRDGRDRRPKEDRE